MKQITYYLALSMVSLSLNASHDESIKPRSSAMHYAKLAGYSAATVANLWQLIELPGEKHVSWYIYANHVYSAYHTAKGALREYTKTISTQEANQEPKSTKGTHYGQLIGGVAIFMYNTRLGTSGIGSLFPTCFHCEKEHTFDERLRSLHSIGTLFWNAKLAYNLAKKAKQDLSSKVETTESS